MCADDLLYIHRHELVLRCQVHASISSTLDTHIDTVEGIHSTQWQCNESYLSKRSYTQTLTKNLTALSGILVELSYRLYSFFRQASRS